MAAKGDLITSDEFNLLKRMVQEEINRRSTSRSRGSMSAYNGSAYQYTMTPAKGVTVTNEHIQKVTKPLDAVNGSSITPTPSGDVEASTVQQAAQKLNELKAKPEVGSNTGCVASCSGLCYSGCYSSCSGCTGSCTGNCTGSCTGSCTGGCSTTCTGSCTGSCNTTCSGTCSGSCTSTCARACSSGCSGSCSGSCSGDCDSCSGSCGGCDDSCSSACTNG